MGNSVQALWSKRIKFWTKSHIFHIYKPCLTRDMTLANDAVIITLSLVLNLCVSKAIGSKNKCLEKDFLWTVDQTSAKDMAKLVTNAIFCVVQQPIQRAVLIVWIEALARTNTEVRWWYQQWRNDI